MIFASYPDSFRELPNKLSPLGKLLKFLHQLIPEGSSIHLLPFFESCGDGGFALKSWQKINKDYGCWNDVNQIGKEYYLYVDLVINHIGIEHPWFQKFLENPYRNHSFFYAYQTSLNLSSPNSPRGGPMLREWSISGQRWLVWQTFNAEEVDINMEHPEVFNAIVQKMILLKNHNVHGLRIDAPAYFGKKLEGPPRHSDDSYRLARKVAKLAIEKGFKILAQLDTDAKALAYFPPSQGYNIPLVDYSYPINLAASLIKEDISFFNNHLKSTWVIPQPLLRPIRTHDGMLMKSEFVLPYTRNAICKFARENKCYPRVIDGFDYELNCSLPFLFRIRSDQQSMLKRILIAVSVTAFVPGLPYFYLPAILGYVPEDCYNHEDEEPRSLNRLPLSFVFLEEFLKSDYYHELKKLLNVITYYWLPTDYNLITLNDVQVLDKAVLSLSRRDLGIRLIANFSSKTEFSFAYNRKKSIYKSYHVITNSLPPLSIVIEEL